MSLSDSLESLLQENDAEEGASELASALSDATLTLKMTVTEALDWVEAIIESFRVVGSALEEDIGAG